MSESRIKHRSLLLVLVASIGIIGLAIVQFGDRIWQAEDPDWQLYKTMFISEEGRVIDTGNKDISHSEGQGWGMLFAVKYNDKASFNRIWKWTREHLQIRKDPLFVWRWDINNPDNPTPDLNNASDGDLYIAWALQRAGQRWKNHEFTAAARKILHSARTTLIRQYADLTVLLPGSEGFEHEDHLLLNLSYWIFPALKEFDQIDPDPVWKNLYLSGLKLIDKARFGQWNLPSDWIALFSTGEIKLTSDFPARFSYDAIRVPLSLLWGQVADQKLLKPYKKLSDHFSKLETVPAWIDLENNHVAPYQASDGFLSIMALSEAILGNKSTPPTVPHVRQGQDYYSASLVMLTRQAISEIKINE